MLALVTALAVSLAGLPAVSVVAEPSSVQTSADRARVNRAVSRFDAARKRASDTAARVRRASDDLDRVMEEQDAILLRIESRAVAIYRTGDTGYLSLLFSAQTLDEFTQLWDLSVRMNEQDAADLIALDAARVKAEKSARSLLTLQSEGARAVDATALEVAAARKTLAKSTAALKAYEARIAAARRATELRNDPPQGLTGTGSWLTGVASHYSKNFTGRGASGARITPYSMMVAHKTLPFHTLIEFEYGGRRAVASVEDRGPYTKGRMFDLGPGVVRALNFSGVHPVRYRIIGR
jgi:hypothetical protein